jgi:hypothetical protein
MPGPKMGPRPADFDEDLIRQSPTFAKWMKLTTGEKLKYACREFVKGRADDDERLMRRYVCRCVALQLPSCILSSSSLPRWSGPRLTPSFFCLLRICSFVYYEQQQHNNSIMIARRNNLKDHGILKQARKLRPRPFASSSTTTMIRPTTPALLAAAVAAATAPSPPPPSYSDAQVRAEMDVEAVRKTRSYRHWETLRPGETFLYNQTYVKGQKDHDWLLQKNIWRRMRYRRENKRIVQDLVLQPSAIEAAVAAAVQRSHQAAITAALLVDPDHPNAGEYHPILGEDGCDEPNSGNHHHLLMCDSIAQAALDAQLAFQTFREEADQEEAMAAAAAAAAQAVMMDGHNDRGSSGTTDHDNGGDTNTAPQQQYQQQRQHDDDNAAAAAATPDHHDDHDDDLLIATAAAAAAAAVAHDTLLGDEVPV